MGIGICILVCWYLAFMAQICEGTIEDRLSNTRLGKVQRIIFGVLCGPVGWFYLLTTEL